MRKYQIKTFIMILGFLFFLLACKGSTDLPVNYSFEFMGWEGRGISFIDRKVDSILLDTSQKGVAVLILTMTDEFQIGKKRETFSYSVYIKLYETKKFNIKNK